MRFYEGAGLLPAGRTGSGYRTYGDDAVERLAFIGSAKHLGLPLEEIGELLDVWETGACAEVKADLRPRIAARLAEAEQRAAELEAFTTSLRVALEHLDALPDRSGRCDPRCGFLTGPVPEPVDVTLAPRDHAAGDGAVEDGAARGAEPWRSAPVACSLGGDGMAERAGAWRALLDGARPEAIPDGLRLTVPADRAGAVAELAAAEQECCPFFDFRLHVHSPRLTLEVRAPVEAAGLLTELFSPAS